MRLGCHSHSVGVGGTPRNDGSFVDVSTKSGLKSHVFVTKKNRKGTTMKEFFNKMVRSKFSILYLIIFIGGLYMMQEKAIMPMVLKVVNSEAFFEKPVDENEPLGKLDGHTERTAFALANCRDAVKKEGDLDENATFMDDNYDTWALGNRQYLIRSSVRVNAKDKGPEDKLYACTVRMVGEDQSKPESWNILGVDFNPESN
ncbi:MAG: hypothetical protein WCO47_05145 [Methylococcus sp.]